MKPRESLLRVRQFEIEEKRQQAADLESMINDFRRMAADLDLQIEAEHQKSGIRDVNHFAYPPFAKAARQRRDNLTTSVEDLMGKLNATKSDLASLEEELRRSEAAGERSEERHRFSRRPSPRSRRSIVGPGPQRSA
ncbi:MAG: flagellar export protein FliJ [Hyphomicrobiaceae bacterium]